MYERFFGFRERPFDLTLNPRYLVLTHGHREALSNLEYGIASGKGITLIVGDAGMGKTTVIRAAMARQPATVHCVHFHNPALTRAEFFELLAMSFGLGPQASRSKAACLVELEQLLRHRRDKGETSALIVDEAQSVPEDLLEEIRLLANIETDDHKLLSVIVAGQPQLAERLNLDSLRQFKQRVALRCALRPLTLQETIAYIAGRIRTAGGVASQVFTREAVIVIHENAGGIPRLISVITDNALLSAFALDQRPVTSQIVREVCQDFALAGENRGRPDTPAAAEPSAPVSRSMLDIEPDTSYGDDATAEVEQGPPADAPDAASPSRRFSLRGRG